jgi:DNA-binding NarL/FixJ family response regulator
MAADAPVRVLIADDHRILRESLRLVLAKGGCEVIGEASSGEEALALAAKFHPDVVVMDIAMPGTGGLAAAHRMRRDSPSTRVLILSAYDDEEYVIEALAEAGAAGYMVKTDAAEELLNAVRTIRGGKRYLSPSIAPILLGRVNDPRPRRAGGATLTRREREVLRLIGEGATSKDIAQKLGISPKTAQVHRENLKEKINARTTAGMVRYAIKHKILKLD